MYCPLISGLSIAVVGILIACTTTYAATKGQPLHRNSSPKHDLKFDTDYAASPPTNIECHVGSLCIVRHPGLLKLDKSLVPSWLVLQFAENATYQGIPTSDDVGTHMLPEINLVIQVAYSIRDLAAGCRGHHRAPTVAVISIDADLPSMTPGARIALFSRLAHLVHAEAPEQAMHTIFYLSRAQNQPEGLRHLFLLATGPGNTAAMRTNGSLLAWRVGCGAVAPSQLQSLQRLEKTAVTGELARTVGFPVRQWFVADDKRLAAEMRRLRRQRRRRSATTNQLGPEVATNYNSFRNEGSGGSSYDYDPMYGSGDSMDNSVDRPIVPVETFVKSDDEPPRASYAMPLLVVRNNVRGKRFKFNPWSFIDKEDGNAEYLTLMLTTKNGVDVNTESPRWLEFRSTTRELIVRDPAQKSPGNHTLRLCAFDKARNKACEALVLLIIDADSEEAWTGIEEDIYVGEYFQIDLPKKLQTFIRVNIDENWRKLTFKLEELTTYNSYKYSKDSWVQFNSSTLQFYGFPTLQLMDQKATFRLLVDFQIPPYQVTRESNIPYGIIRIDFRVKQRRQNGLTHTIAMNISNPRFGYQQFWRNPWYQVDFIKKLAEVFGERQSLQHFLVQNIRQPDSFYSRFRRQVSGRNLITVEWAYLSAFAKNSDCDINALRIIMNRLFEIEGRYSSNAYRTVIWRPSTRDRMRPYELYGFQVKAQGVCESRASEFVPTIDSNWLNKDPIIEMPRKPQRIPRVIRVLPIDVFIGIAFNQKMYLEDYTFVDMATSSVEFDDRENKPEWMTICNNNLCGLAMPKDKGKYDLRVKDRGDPAGQIYQLEIRVQYKPNHKYLNHRFNMVVYPLDNDFEALFRQLKKRLELVKVLAEYLDPNCGGRRHPPSDCVSSVALLRIEEKPHQEGERDRVLEIDWAWTPLYKENKCPRNDIRNTHERLNGEIELLRPLSLDVLKVSVGFAGPCLRDNSQVSYTEATLPVKGNKKGLSLWKILLIVGTIFVLVAVVGGGVALFCFRSSRNQKKEGSEPVANVVPANAPSRAPQKPTSSKPPEREPLTKINRSGMYADEMDDAPAAPTKPLILPHEKPPVPPPDFGMFDLNSRPTPTPPSRSSNTTMPRRQLNPYRNMPPNFDERGARHV